MAIEKRFASEDYVLEHINTLNEEISTKVDKELFDKHLSDAEKFALKSDFENIELSNYETTENAQLKLNEAKTYADTVINGKASQSDLQNLQEEVNDLEETINNKSIIKMVRWL